MRKNLFRKAKDICRVMGEILDAWCGSRTKSGATVAKLSDALDEAKLGFQAQAIRHMVGNEAGRVNVKLYMVAMVV